MFAQVFVPHSNTKLAFLLRGGTGVSKIIHQYFLGIKSVNVFQGSRETRDGFEVWSRNRPSPYFLHSTTWNLRVARFMPPSISRNLFPAVTSCWYVVVFQFYKFQPICKLYMNQKIWSIWTGARKKHVKFNTRKNSLDSTTEARQTGFCLSGAT